MKLLLDGKDYYRDFSFWKYLEFAFVLLVVVVFDILAFPGMKLEIIVLALAVEGMVLFFVGAFTVGSGPGQVRQIRFYDEGVKFHAQGLGSKEKYLPYSDITKLGLTFYARGSGIYSECEIKTISSYERIRMHFWSPFGFRRFVGKAKEILEAQGFAEKKDAQHYGRIEFIFEKS